eukprot:gene30992-37455_t
MLKQKTEFQLNGNLYRRNADGTSWANRYVSLSTDTGTMKFYVEKSGKRTLKGQVNIRQGRLEDIDQATAGRAFAFAIINETLGTSEDANIVLAAPDQTQYDQWIENVGLCFTIGLTRRRKSLMASDFAEFAKDAVNTENKSNETASAAASNDISSPTAAAASSEPAVRQPDNVNVAPTASTARAFFPEEPAAAPSPAPTNAPSPAPIPTTAPTPAPIAAAPLAGPNATAALTPAPIPSTAPSPAPISTAAPSAAPIPTTAPSPAPTIPTAAPAAEAATAVTSAPVPAASPVPPSPTEEPPKILTMTPSFVERKRPSIAMAFQPVVDDPPAADSPADTTPPLSQSSQPPASMDSPSVPPPGDRTPTVKFSEADDGVTNRGPVMDAFRRTSVRKSFKAPSFKNILTPKEPVDDEEDEGKPVGNEEKTQVSAGEARKGENSVLSEGAPIPVTYNPRELTLANRPTELARAGYLLKLDA